jgi:hypothetical protein
MPFFAGAAFFALAASLSASALQASHPPWTGSFTAVFNFKSFFNHKR